MKPLTAVGIVIVVLGVIATFVDVEAAPPSGDAVLTAVSSPANKVPDVVTKRFTTTTVALFDVDGGTASAYNRDFITQNITVEAHADNTGWICVKPVLIGDAGTARDTCGEVCAAVGASDITCNHGAADGEWIDPGETKPERLTGKLCLCAETSVGATGPDAGLPLIQAVRLWR
jgi:hypothetical protein